jgi:hypothetical protein
MTAPLPRLHTPAEAARRLGCNERRLRKLARDLGACSVLGRAMMLTPYDIIVILKACTPNFTAADVAAWLDEDIIELAREHDAQGGKDPTGLVYFLLRSNEVKIGYTTDLDGRIKTFRTATTDPFDVLMTVAGTPALELHFHERFSHLRIEREWFRYHGELEEFIARRYFWERVRR